MLKDNSFRSWMDTHPALRVLGRLLFWLLVFVGGLALGLAAFTMAQAFSNTAIPGLLNWLFAASSVQVMWYVTRAAGIMAYLLLWLSTAWGLAVSSKILDHLLHRAFTYDFHQFISLLAIGFLALHMVVLLADAYLPFSIAQILVPFISPYRPLWVGIGVFGFYLTVLVTVTFYLRGRIGMKTFRTIHALSLVAYLGATLHGFFAGTDSALPATQIMYAGTFLVVVFLISYWLIDLALRKSRQAVRA